jgi:hypothetical protein
MAATQERGHQVVHDVALTDDAALDLCYEAAVPRGELLEQLDVARVIGGCATRAGRGGGRLRNRGVGRSSQRRLAG